LDGWWISPGGLSIERLTLAASGATGGGWTLCTSRGCYLLGNLDDLPVTLSACGAGAGQAHRPTRRKLTGGRANQETLTADVAALGAVRRMRPRLAFGRRAVSVEAEAPPLTQSGGVGLLVDRAAGEGSLRGEEVMCEGVD
jgi:hypothetical protein